MNSSVFEKFCRAFIQLNKVTDKKKKLEEETLKKGLEKFQTDTNINMSLETYDILKKCLNSVKKENKDVLDDAKDCLSSATQELYDYVPSLISQMTEKDGKYTGSFPNIGTITYTPSSPYQMVSSLDKAEIIDTILNMENWEDLLEINVDAYLKENERYVEDQKLHHVEEIQNLPGVIKRVHVDKKDVRLTRSRKKSSK